VPPACCTSSQPKNPVEMTDVHRTLLRLTKPLAEENLLAYLLRLTERNDYDRLTWILELGGLQTNIYSNIPYFFDRNQDLSALAVVTETDPTNLRQLQYRAVKMRGVTRYLCFGSALPVWMLSLRYPRMCPDCLREFGFISRIWDLTGYTACVIHRCLLLELCPGCNRRLTWGRNYVSACRCKFDFRRAQTPRTTESELQLCRQIYRLAGFRFHEGRPADGSCSEEKNPLLDLDLAQLLKVIFLLPRNSGRWAAQQEKIFPSRFPMLRCMSCSTEPGLFSRCGQGISTNSLSGDAGAGRASLACSTSSVSSKLPFKKI
jgi:hypothetical protein